MKSSAQKQLLQEMMQRYLGSSNTPSNLDAELAPERPPEWGEARPVEKPGYGSLSKLSSFRPETEAARSTPAQPAPAATKIKEEPNMSVGKPARVSTYGGGKSFVEGLMKRGWTREEAAAAAGNAHVESGFRPGVKSSVPNEQSFGYLQWNSKRLQGLKNFAVATGRDWTDPEAQLDWIHLERVGDSIKYGGANEKGMYTKALEGGGSPQDLAERFGRFVERPLKLSDTVEQRRQAAAQYAATVGRT